MVNHLILKQFLQASYFTMYITKLVFYTVVLCVSELCNLKTALFCTAGGDKYPLIHVHYYYHYLYRYSIFYNLWRQFTKIYQQMWYDDLHIQVLHVYKTVWLEICFWCFLTQQIKQQNEALFLLYFLETILWSCANISHWVFTSWEQCWRHHSHHR